MNNQPKPLEEISVEHAKNLKWLLTDVDDTLTLKGQLPPETLKALSDLQASGIHIVAVTGACAGWCDQMAKLWPLFAVLGENGAFSMQKTPSKFIQTYAIPAAEMKHQQQELLSKLTDILHKYPDIHFAQDQAYRFCDVAIDIAQERPRVDEHIIESILRDISELEIEGNKVNATLSSIHINVWIGSHSKQVSSLKFLQQFETEINLDEIMYIGDSLNDESMFEWLKTTVGVANIKPYLAQLKSKPSHITTEPAGKGFRQFAEHILRLRN